MNPLITICILGFLHTAISYSFSTSMSQLSVNSTGLAEETPSLNLNGVDSVIVDKEDEYTTEDKTVPKKSCRSAALFAESDNVHEEEPEPEQQFTKRRLLCGNPDKEDDRCFSSCVAGGFFQGNCSSENECFCHRDNPDRGFIIERRHPVMRRVKPKNGDSTVKSDHSENQKEITLVTDDYTSGYVDVDVNLNFEWDLGFVNQWFQSFNLYNSIKCDPCLCPTGCAIYGYYSGYCTPGSKSECMCATVARKPKEPGSVNS